MKILMTVLAITLLLPVAASARYSDNEIFNQLVVLLELDEGDQKKLAVAFVTLGENLHAATQGVGDESFDSRDMFEDFRNAGSTFRDQVHGFLSEEQYAGMMRYSSAILHAIADAVALVRVTEFKESLELDEDQVTALTLVVGDDLRRIVEIFQGYDNWDLDMAHSDAMNKTLTGIRENTRADIQKILNSTQWATLKRLQKEAKLEAESE